MANRTEAYNLRDSVRITDPNTFPKGAAAVARFQPHEPEKPVGYICANVLPTAEGYQSFFGTRQQLGTELLPEETYDVFTFLSPTGDGFAIALTSQSIKAQSVEFNSPLVLVDQLADELGGFTSSNYGVGV